MTKRVYVGDGDSHYTALIGAALGARESYEPMLFTDGLALYNQVRTAPPRLLVLDLVLPSLAGLAVIRLLKFHDDYSAIPILVISSASHQQIREEIFKVKTDAFLQKPFNREQFLEQIDRLI